MPKFSKPLILLALAAAITATLGVGAQPAEARTMSICSRALIHDWYVDGRVDQTYPVHCYREALKQIPEDQIIYGTLREDLTRALRGENFAAVMEDDGGFATTRPGMLASCPHDLVLFRLQGHLHQAHIILFFQGT